VSAAPPLRKSLANSHKISMVAPHWWRAPD